MLGLMIIYWCPLCGSRDLHHSSRAGQRWLKCRACGHNWEKQ